MIYTKKMAHHQEMVVHAQGSVTAPVVGPAKKQHLQQQHLQQPELTVTPSQQHHQHHQHRQHPLEVPINATGPAAAAASTSRYRALRGKSVSSLRPFDIFRDDKTGVSIHSNRSNQSLTPHAYSNYPGPGISNSNKSSNSSGSSSSGPRSSAGASIRPGNVSKDDHDHDDNNDDENDREDQEIEDDLERLGSSGSSRSRRSSSSSSIASSGSISGSHMSSSSTTRSHRSTSTSSGSQLVLHPATAAAAAEAEAASRRRSKTVSAASDAVASPLPSRRVHLPRHHNHHHHATRPPLPPRKPYIVGLAIDIDAASSSSSSQRLQSQPLPSPSLPASPPPLPPTSPASPAVLNPKPANASLKPSLSAFESLRSPIESVKGTFLKAAHRRAAGAGSGAAGAPAPLVVADTATQGSAVPVTPVTAAAIANAASPALPLTAPPPPPPLLPAPFKGEDRRVIASKGGDDNSANTNTTPDSRAAAHDTHHSPIHHNNDNSDNDDAALLRNADRDSGKVIPSTPEIAKDEQKSRRDEKPLLQLSISSPLDAFRRHETPPLPQQQCPQSAPDNDKEAASLLAARLEAETDRILAEQKKLDLARLQTQPVASAASSRPGRRPLLDKLAFLSRARRPSAKAAAAAAASQPTTPSSLAPSVFSPVLAGGSQYSRSSSVDDSASSSPPPPPKMSFIEPGGKGIVPQFDAPTSAINGGERRVIVRCLSSTITLPITAETSPTEIVQSAAKMTNHVVTPTTCVVIECYFMLGLERRLRRYERVRDVLNSWDNDEQNSLIILPSDSPKEERGLDIESVPRTEESPTGFCLQLYHSARPGKWHKRWVTLMDSGQMFASKRPDAGPADKDSSVLCHLSDFDIYMPKESEMRRNLKPPKKFCYAIKSQQKTFVFPNGENFVHFFCTDDEKVASRFHDIVHGWRSWYLVNRMVDLARKDKPPQISYNLLNVSKSPKSVEKSPQVSIDETSYQSDEPLMDVKGFKVPEGPFIIETPLAKRPPKEPLRQKSLADADAKQSEFAAGGLLGDAYDKRKQDEVPGAQTRGQEDKEQSPFTDGPSLLNGGVAAAVEPVEKKPEPKSWFPSATEHSARSRSQSIQQQQVPRRPATADAGAQLRRDKHPHPHHHQPLLSFGKDFPEPPRFRDNYGHGPRHASSGQPLINFATGGPPPPSSSHHHPHHHQHHGSLPHRTMSRRGVSASNSAPPMPPLPQNVRNRSRSAGGPASVSSAASSGSRRYLPDDTPPVPALPNRSGRRDRFPEPPHGTPSGRHPEPLVNRAR